MFLSDASVRRPIAMSCLIIALTLLGLNASRKMGLELLPKMDLPNITVVTVYPGASPSEIETDVAKRIEDTVVSIDGLKHVTSSCMENVCHTMLEFQLGVNVDIAATDVREKIDLVRADFPEGVEDPKIQKFDINAKPIVTLALAGTVPLEELFDYADNTLRDRLTVIAGVADVQLIGGAEREVQIQLDRGKLSARGLSSTDIVTAIQNGIRTIPSGRIQDRGTEYSIKFDADFAEVADIGNLEVRTNDGQRCHIKDLGTVQMTTAEVRQSAYIDGENCIAIKVVKKADANAVYVTNKVRAALGKLNENLPGGMNLIWVTDDGRFIEANNDSAWMNVLQGIILTAGILFIFLYNLRSLLVVAVTMPLTILIGLFFMQMCDFTLNNSTLIAIGMSVGILVTNSIVVLEAIVSHLNETGDPKEASRLGSKEAFIAVLASAGTNVVVLFPLSIMDSIVGQFIRPLALTMFIMTVVSLFISFTLTPLLCSIILRPVDAKDKGLLRRMEQLWNKGFDKLVEGYRATLQFTERNRWAAVLVLLLVFGMFIHAMRVAKTLGSSMVSKTDKGEMFVKLEYPTRYSLEKTLSLVRDVEGRLKDVPELTHILTTIGKVEGVIGQSSEGVYLAQILLKFSERDERDITINNIEREIRSRMTDSSGAIVTITQPSIIGGQSADVEMEISGDDLAHLDHLALEARELTSKIPGTFDLDTTVRTGKPEMRIRPRRAVLADIHTPAVALGMNLRANIEGITAATFKKNARNYDIVVKLAREEGKDQITEFNFPGMPGQPISLETVATVSEDTAPVQITRKDKRRVSKLFSNLAPSLPVGMAVAKITETLAEKQQLPPGYEYFFAGQYEKMKEGMGGLGEAGLISIILIVLTLAAILESFKQTALILVTLPLALIGTFWGLGLAHESMGIFVVMGIVMMAGIVVNNAILIVDQFNIHVSEGIPRHKAMITVSCERFRPIVMITLAAVLGMMPMAFGRGIGAEIRCGVGIASVGGILVSGILTQLVVPILYDLCTRKSRKKTSESNT